MHAHKFLSNIQCRTSIDNENDMIIFDDERQGRLFFILHENICYGLLTHCPALRTNSFQWNNIDIVDRPTTMTTRMQTAELVKSYEFTKPHNNDGINVLSSCSCSSSVFDSLTHSLTHRHTHMRERKAHRSKRNSLVLRRGLDV